MKCTTCKIAYDDLRSGTCFACASKAEEELAKRSCLKHIGYAIKNTWFGKYDCAKLDLKWAWQRSTESGDYAKGGTFDLEGYKWR